ncbi:MAG: LytTR family transcriptional regulator [Lachnospiraceae bacterium]|nr:LytTR family transcriptional regulator [Lachnospiraceae bacterium]
MQVEIKIDSSCKEPKIIVTAASMTEDLQELIRKLSDHVPSVISGIKDGKIEVLQPEDLIRIYANSGKVFAVTDKGEYVVRLRLYDLEQRLGGSQFVRISNSEIVNLRKISSFDLSFTGTICVKLSNGTVTYVSRRYVSKIKKLLGI